MNHRGQTLVLFILILPVLLLVLGFLINLGTLQIQKKKLNNTIDQGLTYGIKHKEDETLEYDIYRILLLNLKTIQNYKIELKENDITIEVTQIIKPIFPIFKEENITIKKRIYLKNDTYHIIKE